MELTGVCLGILSIIWPIRQICQRFKGKKQTGRSELVGLSCCGLYLWNQLRFWAHLASEGKVSAWQDTAGGVVVLSGLLLVLSLLLHAFLLWIGQDR